MNGTELRDLFISYITISIAFAIVLGRGFLDVGNFSDFPFALMTSLIAVGAGFILHELAHRQVAKHFGARAEFRVWNFGLIFAVISAFFGFIFAAPGAVYIYGENIDRKQNGIISIAGPVTNIAMGILFALVLFVSSNAMAIEIATYGILINFWLAFFNLLPIPPLDGSKVLIWNPLIWIAAIAPIGFVIFYVFRIF
ncbi:MAG: site-2 protease family protein [Candidatus ainarchaeum sp.]|nr:site-2 protease family protein [Candidatus ainarchaeum sp.]